MDSLVVIQSLFFCPSLLKYSIKEGKNRLVNPVQNFTSGKKTVPLDSQDPNASLLIGDINEEACANLLVHTVNSKNEDLPKDSSQTLIGNCCNIGPSGTR